MIKIPNSFHRLLGQGIQALENDKSADALGFLKKAAVCEFRHPEPWYWMGRVYEKEGKRELAGYAYFMALDLDGLFRPARDSLEKLGYVARVEL